MCPCAGAGSILCHAKSGQLRFTPVGKDDRPHEHRVRRWTNTRAAANPTFLGAVAPGDGKNWPLITSANAYRGFRPSESPARPHDGKMGGYCEFGNAFLGLTWRFRLQRTSRRNDSNVATTPWCLGLPLESLNRDFNFGTCWQRCL